jgi:hypothetical protein
MSSLDPAIGAVVAQRYEVPEPLTQRIRGARAGRSVADAL